MSLALLVGLLFLGILVLVVVFGLVGSSSRSATGNSVRILPPEQTAPAVSVQSTDQLLGNSYLVRWTSVPHATTYSLRVGPVDDDEPSANLLLADGLTELSYTVDPFCNIFGQGKKVFKVTPFGAGGHRGRTGRSPAFGGANSLGVSSLTRSSLDTEGALLAEWGKVPEATAYRIWSLQSSSSSRIRYLGSSSEPTLRVPDYARAGKFTISGTNIQVRGVLFIQTQDLQGAPGRANPSMVQIEEIPEGEA